MDIVMVNDSLAFPLTRANKQLGALQTDRQTARQPDWVTHTKCFFHK